MGTVFSRVCVSMSLALFLCSRASAYDFNLHLAGTSHVYAGYDAYLVAIQEALSGAPDGPLVLTWELPAGVTVEVIHQTENEVACTSVANRPAAQQCTVYGGLSGAPPLKLHALKTAVPGTYPVPFEAAVGSVVKQVPYTLHIEPAPVAPTRRALTSIPPIPELDRWRARMDEGRGFCDPALLTSLGVYEGSLYYYDGVRVMHQLAEYTGDKFWLDCKDAILKVYRDDYVIPNDGAIPGRRVFSRGLWMDYAKTGDERSKQAALMLGNRAQGPSPYTVGIEFRETAYAAEARLDAWRLGISTMNFRATTEMVMGQADQLFDIDVSTAGQPFMIGLAMDALIDFYQETKDPRVPGYVARLADYVWKYAWHPENKAFMYWEYSDLSQSTPTNDLNLLLAPAWAWLWALTGDPKWQEQGDQIFAGGAVGAGFWSGKQFSQNYRWSFDYVKWRTDPDSVLNGQAPLSTRSTTLNVTAYPNPWRSDRHGSGPAVTFKGLAAGATVKIFSVSGHLLRELHATSHTLTWDLANKAGTRVASGVYVYTAEANGAKVRGKIAVIR